MSPQYRVVVSAGSLAADADHAESAVHFPHCWTAGGVEVAGVRVSAVGEFDTETWTSTGISYTVDVDSPALAAQIDALLNRVDAVAEIPKALRAGAVVDRSGS